MRRKRGMKAFGKVGLKKPKKRAARSQKQVHPLDICAEIQGERWVGNTRCGIVDGRMSLVEAARAFKLADDGAIYRSIGAKEAEAVALRLLHAGLAHPGEIMSVTRAIELWRQFMGLFQGQDVSFAPNARADVASWSPATQATFDMGVLVIGTTKVGCLWVEEED